MNFNFKKGLSYFLLFTLLIMSTLNCNIYASQKNLPNDSRKESQVNFDQMNKVIEENNYTFSIGDNEAMAYPLESLAGLKLPKQLITPSITEPIKPILNLPSKFDWREKDGVTVPKNQGSCGSCWAFSTVGVFESLIKIKDKKTVDLSEQFLISYNNDGWGCNGGWFAHKYHVDPGAVLEKDLPYQGSDYVPIKNLSHPYKLKDWGYVTNQSSVPSVDALKTAIYNYGPISCAVAADSYMQAYTGGVFNHDTNTQVNHAVMIVGWDDSNQTWIMKNSWGTDWGEDGFMNIKYNVCDIGYAACYGVYDGSSDDPDDDSDDDSDNDPSDTNVALNRPVEAYDYYSFLYKPSKIVDGDYSSYWVASVANDSWISVDLESQRTLNNLKIKWSLKNYPKKYSIYYRNGTQWVLAKSVTGDGDIDEIKFDSPIKTNGIYLQFESPNSSYYTIYELEAYGK